jgi:phosphatidylserine/phosphatidylglycerophosphate/cardiolipin synthase-like enzyme
VAEEAQIGHHRAARTVQRTRAATRTRLFRPLLCLLALVTGACGLLPHPDGAAESVPGGLETIAQHYEVKPLDPQSPVPLVKQALEQIEETDPLRRLRGTTYHLSYGNRLPDNWILQTPNVWGKRAAEVRYTSVECKHCDQDFRLHACASSARCRGRPCTALGASVTAPGERPQKFCLGPADGIVDRFYAVVVSAQQSLDITLLEPAADIRFLAALRDGITWLAHSGRPVTIRAIVGDYPPAGFDASAFLHELVRDAAAVPTSRLRVYAAATRSCNAGGSCNGISWNHAKIVAADGKRAIVGGHNMWTPDYLAADPVHDISMEVKGPAAHDAERFADALWHSVCERNRNDGVNATFVSLGAASGSAADCPARIALPEAAEETGGVPILAVGRLASGIVSGFADQSLIARDLMLGAARHTIRMVQQDVGFALLAGQVERSWPESALDKIADLLARKGDVYLILSNLGAAGPVGTYSNGIPIDAVGDKIKDVVQKQTGLDDASLSSLLCQHLHLAPLRFGSDDKWPDGKAIGTHAKFWMVDDRVFYIGSENLYPAELQEFGFIVEDGDAVAALHRDYWDKAWQWSRSAAISGADAPRCMFQDKTAANTRSVLVRVPANAKRSSEAATAVALATARAAQSGRAAR